MAHGKRGKRPPPFSLRLTFEERARIEAQAGDMPVGAYIKSLLLSEDAPRYRQRRKPPVADRALLAQVLACLGASRLASNLNQLAKATHVGNFYFDDDAKLSIKQASEDIAAIRQMLMLALGFEAEPVQRSGSPKSRFNPASAPRLRP